MKQSSEYPIRHPRQVPVRIDSLPVQKTPAGNMLGELVVNSASKFTVGSLVRLRMPTIDSEAELVGQVIWLERGGGDREWFMLGISFRTPDEAFRMRMIEQLCHMAAFRLQAFRHGRCLSMDEAACEWIERFSADFPEVVPLRLH